ncbi:MAG TPA: hypothetical protein V6D11_20335 [Waterburya sp.]
MYYHTPPFAAASVYRLRSQSRKLRMLPVSRMQDRCDRLHYLWASRSRSPIHGEL